jgi:hypothetical protein
VRDGKSAYSALLPIFSPYAPVQYSFDMCAKCIVTCEESLLRVLERIEERNEKYDAQTSIETHPVIATEADEERVEIIATLYTANSELNAAIFADSAKVKASLL